MNLNATQRVAGNLVGRSRCETYGVLPLSLEDNTLLLGYAGQESNELRTKMRLWTRKDVAFADRSAHDIADGILALFGPAFDGGTRTETDQIYDELLRRMGDLRATNAFIEYTSLGNGEEVGRIRLDVEGEIALERILSLENYERLVTSIVTESIQGDSINPQIGQRGKLTVKLDGRDLNLRVSTYPIFHPKRDGLQKVVLRYLQQFEFLPQPSELGMSAGLIGTLTNALGSPKCTIIVGAPPGQGKSTTFYSLMSLFDLLTRNVYAIEDPPEIFYPGITQTPIAPARRWTYEAALTELLRQSPDFVFLGEMLDGNIADLAMSANVRGVPLGTTVHADDALAIIVALRNLGVSPLTIAGGLTILLSQRLIPVLCASCRLPAPVPNRLRMHLERLGASETAPRVYTRGPGCDECLDRGLVGRQGVFEVVSITREIRDAIRASDDSALVRLARADGYVTMLEQAILKILDGSFGVESLAKLPESEAHDLSISTRATEFLAAFHALQPRLASVK